MEIINLNKEDILDFKQFLQDPNVKITAYNVGNNEFSIELNTQQKFIMDQESYEQVVKKESKYSNDLIFGKDKTENVVSVEIEDEQIALYKEVNGSVIKEMRPNYFWIITHDKVSSKQTELVGDQHYKWLAKFPTLAEYLKAKNAIYNYDHYKINDTKEAALIYNGITYYKGMNVSDVSTLSFDIESDGLTHRDTSEIYLITNTFRKNDRLVRKTFRLDHFDNQKEMLLSWAKWVREVDPSIVLGHNIMSYDIPYILHVADLCGADLRLGRNNSSPNVVAYKSKFRKDGSQSYEYNNIYIHGREIVDTMFLSLKFDVGRNFESYGLKAIVKHLGLEKEDRTFVNAGQIKNYYKDRETNPEMWEKVVKYAEEDSDDSLKIFDIMAPSYFYFTQSVSKSFQQMINQATGSQINNMMVRSYLQDGHSIAKADEAKSFTGALSIGVPGFYKNCIRWDIASLYPSIIRQYKVYNKQKDPKSYFLKMVEYFTLERLKNKKSAKETNSSYYKDLEQSQKLAVNSMYGFLGAPGLHYNSPEHAGLVTQYGRDILSQAVTWASGKKVEELIPKQEEEEIEED